MIKDADTGKAWSRLLTRRIFISSIYRQRQRLQERPKIGHGDSRHTQRKYEYGDSQVSDFI